MYDVTYMPESWGMKTLLYPPTSRVYTAQALRLEHALLRIAGPRVVHPSGLLYSPPPGNLL